MYYVGVDLGTSSVKLILCDKDGNLLKSVTKDYPVFYPEDGCSEQNPEDWYNKTIEGLKELCSEYKPVKALSVAGQMHGLVMLDENDNCLRPAILWNDSRSVLECEYLNETIGKDELSKMTANIAFPGFTAPKILWVRKNEEENFKKCKKIMLPKDYLVYKLTGEFVTEPSDASGLLLFDVKNNIYSEKMLEICGISEEMLPKVKKSFEPIGYIKSDIEEKIGVKNVLVAPGAGDNAAAAIGMGVVKDGMCSISLGTSGTVFIAKDSFSVDENNALHSFAHANGKFHLMGCILSAASCNKWWTEDILGSNDYANWESIAPDGESKVFYLPYMMGERSPHNDPNLRGAFVGMSLDTTKEDLAKAVMEGVSYALRDSVEIARESGAVIDEARVCGGGSKSEVWCKILSNILKVRVVKCSVTEGPAMGAVLLAATAAGEYKSVEEATEKTVKIDSYIDYDVEASKKYEMGYKRFKKLHASLKDWYKNEE